MFNKFSYLFKSEQLFQNFKCLCKKTYSFTKKSFNYLLDDFTEPKAYYSFHERRTYREAASRNGNPLLIYFILVPFSNPFCGP